MNSREEPLSKRERAELAGYVSWSATVGRAVLFAAAVLVVGILCRRLQQGFGLEGPFWLLPTLAVAAALYVRSRRWTGGRELRKLFRQDLETGKALVHHVRVTDAIVFEEAEDEGPVVFVLAETGETLVFTGQELSRDVARGFPWREFEVRESASSRRFLALKRLGEPFPVASRPPLSREAYLRLDIISVRRWKPLSIAFDELRGVA